MPRYIPYSHLVSSKIVMKITMLKMRQLILFITKNYNKDLHFLQFYFHLFIVIICLLVSPFTDSNEETLKIDRTQTIKIMKTN